MEQTKVQNSFDFLEQLDRVFFKVTGNVMNDGTNESYADGDVVVCKTEDPQELVLDCDYIFKKKDGGMMFGQLVNKAGNYIYIHFLNQNYADITISLDQIREVYVITESRRNRKRVG